jgi:predicted component of viral defense system (DUF524 family)
MDSPTSSPFSFCDLAEQPLDVPREWTQARVLVPLLPDELPRGRLLLQGAALNLSVVILSGERRVVAEWPRCGTGNYRLLLELAEKPVAHQTVTIRPQKISEATYLALVNDLQAEALPTSIALGLERTGGLAGVDLRAVNETTLEQELLRLRRAVEGASERIGLARALVEIARDPYRILRKTEQWVRVDRARRLEPMGLVQALRRAENLDVATRTPRVVPDTRVEHTYDVYENQLVRLFADQVNRRLRRLATVLAENNQFAGLAGVEQIQHQLDVGLRAATFLHDVGLPEHLQARATMVLLRRPLYQSVFEAFLEFHRDAYIQLDEPALDAPLDNLPHLYETWGALQVVVAALEVGEELGFKTQLQRIARHTNHSVFVRILPDGQPALVLVHPDDGRSITVTPQRSFGRTSSPFHSVSFPQRPDITIEVAQPGRGRSLVVLDPKYKLRSEEMPPVPDDDSLEGQPGQPKKVDIDKMHAYRDAIRDSELRTVVEHAAILYPGPSVTYEAGVAALCALPDNAETLLASLRDTILQQVAR